MNFGAFYVTTWNLFMYLLLTTIKTGNMNLKEFVFTPLNSEMAQIENNKNKKNGDNTFPSTFLVQSMMY